MKKAIVEAFYEQLWNQHDASAIDTILHADVRFRGSLGDEKLGHRGFIDYVDQVHHALAQYHCHIDQLIEERDQIFAKMYFSGIHQNPLLGYSPSHQHVGWSGTALFTFVDAKIQEIWVLGDLKTLETQLQQHQMETEPLHGLNHITFAVNNLDTAFRFYTQQLHFKPRAKWRTGAYLSLGDLWFCLSQGHYTPSADYSHIALSTTPMHFHYLKGLIEQHNIPLWQDNKSEGDSLYILDPDGHKLEIHIGSLQTRLASLNDNEYPALQQW